MKIDYLIDGKSVTVEKVTDETKKKAIKVATSYVLERVKDLRDPETGESPEITIIDMPADGLSFHVKGSEAMRVEVENALFPAASNVRPTDV